MGFGEAVKRCFRHYADLRGRATRAEYWWFVTFAMLINVAVTIVVKYSVALADLAGLRGIAQTVEGASALFGSLFTLALLLPMLAVSVRRFHDVGLSGGWFMLAIAIFFFAAFQNPRTATAAYTWIPMLAALGAIVMVMCLPGGKGANRYGAASAQSIGDVFGDEAGGGPAGRP